MTREDVFRWMREAGWSWDGEDDEDPDGVFVKGDQALTFDTAAYFLAGWKPPTDEVGGVGAP